MTDALTPKVWHGSNAPECFIDEQCFIQEWSNHPDDPAISIAQARVEAGVQTHWHRLQGIDERYVIMAGSGWVEVQGLPAQAVTRGDVVCIPAGHAQRIRNTGEHDLRFLAICTPRFTPDAYENLETPTE